MDRAAGSGYTDDASRRSSFDDRSILIPSSKDTVPLDNESADKLRKRLAAMAYPGALHSMDRDDDIYDDDRRLSKPLETSHGSRCLTPLVILLILCMILLLGFALLAVILKIRMDKLGRVCRTSECSIISGEILSNMDLDQSPCKDFYEYSCGSFNRPENRPPDMAEWNMFTKTSLATSARLRYLLASNDSEYKGTHSSAISKAKLLYTSCLNTTKSSAQGASNLLQFIAELGSWPVTQNPASGRWDSGTWSLQEAIFRTHSFGFDPIFSLSLQMDLKNSSKYVISFDQSGLFLYSHQLYSSKDVEKFRDAYIKYFTDVMLLLGEQNSLNHAQDVWDLERAIAGAFVRREDRVDVESTYNPRTINELQSLIRNGHASFPIDMLGLARKLIHPNVTGSTTVIVEVPEYFRKVGLIIKTARTSTMASYVVWCAVREMAKHAGQEFESARAQFYSVISGVAEEPPRWRRCVSLTNEVTAFATGALYIEKYFSPEDKQKVEDVISMIVNEFIKQMKVLDWMDEGTSNRAIEKAKAIRNKIGYPEFILNPEKLDAYYEDLKITDNTFYNVLSASSFYVRLNGRRYGRTPDKSEWFDAPTDINAYYSRSRNEIIIPAGILQRPFYDFSYPMSLLLGAIGFIVGHELTHGFDVNGRKFNGDGNMADWWTEEAAKRYKERSDCFRKEYDNFAVGGLHLNGLTTLGENIADNVGAKIALATYKRWLGGSMEGSHFTRANQIYRGADRPMPGLNMSGTQQFFLGMAQLWCSTATSEDIRQNIMNNAHSLKRFRVNGVIRNIEDFYDAFKCSESDKPNTRERCTLWR